MTLQPSPDDSAGPAERPSGSANPSDPDFESMLREGHSFPMNASSADAGRAGLPDSSSPGTYREQAKHANHEDVWTRVTAWLTAMHGWSIVARPLRPVAIPAREQHGLGGVHLSPARRSGLPPVWLYGAVVLTGAWLIFWVQPLAVRGVLPVLGGSPAVWNAAMVFFQAALLGGYALAHFLARGANTSSAADNDPRALGRDRSLRSGWRSKTPG